MGRKRRKVRGKIKILPDDIIMEILLRLRAKSLYRFRSVCKSWNSLLSSNFIRSLNKGNHQKLFLSFSENYSTFDSYEASFDSDANAAIVAVEYPFKDSASRINEAKSLASLDSWLLMGDRSCRKFWFLNTCTRQYKEFLHCFQHSGFPSFYGISYDCSKNEYKVVSVFGMANYENNEWMAVIFSLKTNSWTKFVRFPYSLSNNSQHGVSVNGAPHWVCYKDPHHYVIVRLDNKVGEFIEVPKPCIDGPFDLSAIEGNLFAYCYLSPGSFAVWEMMEYGVKGSWIQVCTIRLSSERFAIKPLAITKTGEVIVLSGNGKELFICDTQENKSKTLLKFQEDMRHRIVSFDDSSA